MSFEFGFAETPDEVAAVQNLRYDVYVEELGRYGDNADHERRLLIEPEDAYSWMVYARDGDTYLATGRLTWGGNPEGFSARQLEQYRLQPFLDDMPASLLAVGERLMVRPEFRGTPLLPELLDWASEATDSYNVQLSFGACEPHLLSLYVGQGHLTYADKNINSAGAGYLIPIVLFKTDAESLLGAGFDSHDDAGNALLPRSVEKLMASQGGAVTSSVLETGTHYRGTIEEALRVAAIERTVAFADFTSEEVARCVTRSTTIECQRGDVILKAGGTARNIFVVLDGILEARAEDGTVVGVLSPGDAIGETAFLLDQPRSADVAAVTDDVRLLSLSEGTLRKMIHEDPVVAAKFLLNLSRMLCHRLLLSN